MKYSCRYGLEFLTEEEEVITEEVIDDGQKKR
jgi:hypothetical protein